MTDQPKPPKWGPLPKFGDNFTEEEWAEINMRSDLEAERAARVKAERRIERLERALDAGFLLVDGRAHFKTQNGTPMQMPVRAERVVRAALKGESRE